MVSFWLCVVKLENPIMKTAKRIKVIGKVQGVFYRKSTQDQAKKLGLVGWVKNDEDGSVLAEVEGDRENVLALESWMRKGPENAIVDNFLEEEIEERGYSEFQIVK